MLVVCTCGAETEIALRGQGTTEFVCPGRLVRVRTPSGPVNEDGHAVPLPEDFEQQGCPYNVTTIYDAQGHAVEQAGG